MLARDADAGQQPVEPVDKQDDIRRLGAGGRTAGAHGDAEIALL